MNSLLRPPLPGPSLCARRRASPSPAARRLGSAALAVGGRRCRRGLSVAASAAPSWMEEAGVEVLEEGGRRNPSVSDSYRPAGLPRPNATVLEAQGRVCTGPGQTRPLGEEQAMRVLDTILRSAMGELKEEPVSSAQLGAFFAGMTIRANSFPEATQWSEGERRAMSIFWPRLVQVLPPEVKFIADPEGTIMGANGLTGPRYVGQGTREMRLVGALREVLAGGHLGYEEVQCVLKDILPIGSNSSSTVVSEALLAAFLIGQRMNRETDRELKAYCLAFDDELGPPPVADVKSLTHYGEPYDGNTRFFRSTLFVAAVRACYGESSLLHGVEWMPPKGGITEGQMLKFMGANIRLSPTHAKTLLEDENAGFAYLNLQEACPPLYSIIGLREHIKKRPPIATSEKVQQFVRARGRESMIAGFYHEGYEDPLLMLMRRRTVHAGLVVKGEEGALSMTTKERSAHASKGLPVNHCSGFRTPNSINSSETDGIPRESFRVIVNAQELGFESTETPRTDRSVLKNLELGLAALGGEKGAAYDRIVLNAAMADHLLGCSGAEDINAALDRTREAIDSGNALRRLMSYIKISHKVT
ncbi:hypothetical protein SETIT_1G097900v2 [Setaria italica]|uniref:Glycosyl transferase family 3 domain-containing protein n=1 Tax=Setaria italica TaxID=4555 RepID=K3YR34_SETIT|nr:uncharacterized protein LOC101780432 [Setaria italica]RCV05628.1 hypothetical protein SETIT_1G097900v2 [Setaria italica]